jgi:excisionase family DNA binding protein
LCSRPCLSWARNDANLINDPARNATSIPKLAATNGGGAIEECIMSTMVPGPVSGPFALSVNEAIKFSGIGRTKFYELLKNNQIPARKCGRRTIILKCELEEFLKSLPQVGRAA